MKKWELAYEDYQAGMKYKEIAEKYEVSINTVKSWKSRKWGAPPEEKVAHKKKKVATKKEVKPVIENKNLTEQQKMFCLFYLQHFNATKAYQQAYPNASYGTANAEGSSHLAKPSIKEELHRLKAELQQDVFVTVQDLVSEYIKQAYGNVNDYIKYGKREVPVMGMFGPVLDENDNQLMKEVNYVDFKESDTVDGSIVKEVKMGKDGVSVKLYDKQKAMSELMKYLDVDVLKQAQTEKAQAEAAIVKNKADKLTGGGKATGLLQALLDVKSGGDGSGNNVQQ